MNTHHKAAILGCLAVATGTIVWKRRTFQMPFKEFTRYALYMAVMDDEICRNELEGNDLGGVRIEFPDKMDSLQMRYHLFLQMNQKKSRQQILDEIAAMEQRLQDSRQYIGQPSVNLSASISQK
ncbi:hypothetical protein B5E65_01835 [Gemmiger sp. An120]|uniref:hypothetical protein n=1 Tax=Gemmiger sp. An120 TaxID=1965549 RepID=UPI000B38BE74|nr:hypothetical protein [Gemmiger sp. An120]OUQ43742.1 hypothetical protein B5E65_01835 [Gemmiger sp. An120]